MDKKSIYVIILIIMAVITAFSSFYIVNIHSFYSILLSIVLLILGILFLRKDLLIPMLTSGVLMMVGAIPFYLIGLYINPNWIQTEWYINKLSGLFLLGIPIEEFVWFFFVGTGFSCVWEALFNVKYIEIKKIKSIVKTN